jgi:hypothetical protein
MTLSITSGEKNYWGESGEWETSPLEGHLDDIAARNRLTRPNADPARKHIRNRVCQNFNYSKPSTINQYFLKVVREWLSVDIFIFPIHDKFLTCILGGGKAFLNRGAARFRNSPWSTLTREVVGDFLGYIKLISHRIEISVIVMLMGHFKSRCNYNQGGGYNPHFIYQGILVAPYCINGTDKANDSSDSPSTGFGCANKFSAKVVQGDIQC